MKSTVQVTEIRRYNGQYTDDQGNVRTSTPTTTLKILTDQIKETDNKLGLLVSEMKGKHEIYAFLRPQIQTLPATVEVEFEMQPNSKGSFEPWITSAKVIA